MVSVAVQQAVVGATMNSILIEILLYGMLHSTYRRILLSNVYHRKCTIRNVCSIYAGTVYIYCENKNIVLMLTTTTKIGIDSVKEVPYKLVYCCIHHKFIHYPCH